MSTGEIYLDGAASTPLDPRVIETMDDAARRGAGNVASIHWAGVAAARCVERARAIVAGRLGATPDEIVFCGSGTEGNNHAVLGTAWAEGRGHLVISAVEHASVLEPARWLETQGFSLTLLPVDSGGRVRPADLAQALRPETILVSVHHGNNESGAVQPIADLGRICRSHPVRFHVDACQSFGKLPVRPDEMGADLVTVDGHKLHGPHGVGALYVREGIALAPLLRGGGQERGLRSGTHNTEGIAGFGRAVELADEADAERLAGLRQHLLERLRAAIPTLCEVAGSGPVLPSVLTVRFPGHSGKAIAMELSRRGIAVGTGSACQAGEDRPSRVLLAMGLTPGQCMEAVRFGLHRFLDEAMLDRTVEVLTEVPGNRGQA